MKSFKSYVVLSVILMVAILVVMAQGVMATTTPPVLFTQGTNGTTTNGTTTNTQGTNDTTTNATPATNSNPSSLVVTNSNLNTTKDNATSNTVNVVKQVDKEANLPKTGENDIYIVSAIGAVALIIGGVAYAKSRRYDM